MDDWLFTPTATSSSSTTVSWVTADRCTGCDIMCVSNTHLVEKHGDHAKAPAMRASMPYKPTKSFHSLPKGTTHYQRFKLDDGRRAQTEMLRAEMYEFFTELENERDDRKMIEDHSATMIQAIFRGFLRRFKMNNCTPRVLPPRTQHQLQDELCHWAVLLNLKPVRGLSLENRGHASKRFARIQKAAAIRIQTFFKMLVHRTRARIYMAQVKLDKFNRASVLIARFVKRLRECVKKTKAKNQNNINAAITIQCFFRTFRACQRVRAARRAKHTRLRQLEAVTIIGRSTWVYRRRFEEKSRRWRERRNGGVVKAEAVVDAALSDPGQEDPLEYSDDPSVVEAPSAAPEVSVAEEPSAADDYTAFEEPSDADAVDQESITVADLEQSAQPVAEGPVTEEPVVEEPVVEEPVVEEPVAEEPVAEEAVAEEPVAEEPVAEDPVAEEPVAEEPVAEEPVAEEPVAEEAVAEEPVAEEPMAEEPVAEEPMAEEPVAEEPVTEAISAVSATATSLVAGAIADVVSTLSAPASEQVTARKAEVITETKPDADSPINSVLLSESDARHAFSQAIVRDICVNVVADICLKEIVRGSASVSPAKAVDPVPAAELAEAHVDLAGMRHTMSENLIREVCVNVVADLCFKEISKKIETETIGCDSADAAVATATNIVSDSDIVKNAATEVIRVLLSEVVGKLA